MDNKSQSSSSSVLAQVDDVERKYREELREIAGALDDVTRRMDEECQVLERQGSALFAAEDPLEDLQEAPPAAPHDTPEEDNPRSSWFSRGPVWA